MGSAFRSATNGLFPLLSSALILVPAPASAAEPASLDVAPLTAPTSPTRYVTLEPTESLGHRTIAAGARLSFLRTPLELRTPAATPDGTSSPAVDNHLRGEILLAGGIGRFLDVGASLPVIFFQDGSSLAPVGQTARLPSPALGDPRLFLAYALSLYESFRLRPYGAVLLPLATKNAFAGGSSVRGVLGFATSVGEASRGTIDASLHLEDSTSIGLSEFGSHVRVGLGFAQLLPLEFGASFEAVTSLPLTSQRSDPEGVAPILLPFELLGSLRKTFERHQVGLVFGAGLPTSRTSSLSGERAVLAPTSPVFRIALEYRFVLEAPNNKPRQRPTEEEVPF